jgi:hypothetical protein
MQIDVQGEGSGQIIATCRTTYVSVPRASVAKAPREAAP